MPSVSNTNLSPPATTSAPPQTQTAPLSVVTTLFFMWGFLTCLNDILVPHLKAIFDLNYAQVMLIQFAFFSAYFIFSIPSAKVIDWIGYQKTMVLGLFVMALGAVLFIPAASVPSFPLFLGALMVLAARARAHSLESSELDAGFQFARYISCAVVWQGSDSEHGRSRRYGDAATVARGFIRISSA